FRAPCGTLAAFPHIVGAFLPGIGERGELAVRRIVDKGGAPSANDFGAAIPPEFVVGRCNVLRLIGTVDLASDVLVAVLIDVPGSRLLLFIRGRLLLGQKRLVL